MIDQLVRPNIRAMSPYSSARDESDLREGVFLDANESPYGTLNRYPDPQQTTLKNALAACKGLSAEQIFIGNGSDEAIDILLRMVCIPGRDNILICPPTYGMYQVAAATNDVGVIQVPLNQDFQPDLPGIAAAADTAKIIFLCSPNNPTGNTLLHIESILKASRGLVVVDEAYQDFSTQPSAIRLLSQYPQLVVLQTFSKARGLAAARVGMAFAAPDIINYMNKVKPPYNVSSLNQAAALEALAEENKFQQELALIRQSREQLRQELQQLPFVETVYPSEANFLLVAVTQPQAVYDYLCSQHIIVRNRHAVVPGCLRISVGTAEENQVLLQALNAFQV
jgi:histidinol-phosphate aminotransferase